MDWDSLRRIVTENTSDGRSKVLIDGGAAKMIAVEEAGLAEIWSADLHPSRLYRSADVLADQELRLEPDEGAVKVRWFSVAPDNDGRTADEKEAAAAFGFAAVGASEARVDTRRHPMMHKTKTLDVIILVKGEVSLLLDEDGPHDLKPGDVIIQSATNHAWVNNSDETALLVAVLINAGEQQ